jgi:hypothetical protein
MFDESSTFQFYKPNETFTWSQPQVLTEWSADWRFANDHMAFTDQQIELNFGPGMSQAHQRGVFKDLMKTIEMRAWTSMLNGIEDQLFKAPVAADMEAAAGDQPYSVPAFVNEETNGNFFSLATPTGSTPWTTVENVSGTNEANWRNQQAFYDSATVNDDNNIISNFDDMFFLTKFQNPGTKEEYFENDDLFAQFIACSRKGINVYKQLMRESQDTYVTSSRQDPAYNMPQYSGIDLQYVDNLDSELLYAAETATAPLVAEVVATGVGEASGPRYYWLNGKYLHPVFHTTRYMQKHKAMRHPNQPYTTIVPMDCWYNIVCRSRRRQGIVSPLPTAEVYLA